MFKALLRRIVEAVQGAIENEQEQTDLSVRIPVGYLVACRRAHGQGKRHTRKSRRQRRDKADNAELRKQIAEINSEKEKISEQHNKEVDELNEALEAAKAERDQENAARNAAENCVQKLREKKSSLESDLADVSKELERRMRFPHLEFGPDAVDDYENLRSDDLPMVNKRLNLLDETAMEWRVKGGIMPPWKCDARDEGDTVKSNPKFREQRRFKSCHDGAEYFFWHINCGELDGKKGRIHFRFDESTHEIEVGYIGKHLELPTA